MRDNLPISPLSVLLSLTFTLLPPFFRVLAAIEGQKWVYRPMMVHQSYPDGEFGTEPSDPPCEPSDPPEY
jgi:hypothetical protein